MKNGIAMVLIVLLSTLVTAGWADLRFDSPEDLQDFHQGRNITLSLEISNTGQADGYAVYITNITLQPPSCVNGGQPIYGGGGIICPTTDPSCRNRFRNADSPKTFVFEDIPTDPNCINGLKEYRFTLEGNKEYVSAGSKWSSTPQDAETNLFYLRFVGKDYCGDDECVEGIEDCASCPQDCGPCPECNGTERACVNNTIMECENGFFTKVIENCKHGCEDLGGSPECIIICQEGETVCADNQTLQTCTDNDWVNTTCIAGCTNGACETDLCGGVTCPDHCNNSVAYSYGACDYATGQCVYYDAVPCQYGCASDGINCEASGSATPTPTPYITTPPADDLCGGTCCMPMAIVLFGAALVLMPFFSVRE